MVGKSKSNNIISKLKDWFDSSREKVFRYSDLEAILHYHHERQIIPESLKTKEFVAFLLEERILKAHHFVFSGIPITVYVRGQKYSIYEMALKTGGAGAYISHYSAAFINELTDQVPKTIYVTVPQARKHSEQVILTQEQIDSAFSTESRPSKAIVSIEGYRIARLNSMDSEGVGVVESKAPEGTRVLVTDIERTLLDIVVRPIYAGGPHQVLQSFSRAYGRMSTNRLMAYYKKMKYIYPYHQAIGFYMEKAGNYSDNSIKMLRNIKKDRDFYLLHGMTDAVYVPEWRLFVPKGF